MWSAFLFRVVAVCALIASVSVHVGVQAHNIHHNHHHDQDQDDPQTYIAGALQWAPYGDSSQPAASVVAANLQQFATQVAAAKQQQVQILVFNEGGLGMFNAEVLNTRDAMLPYCEAVPAPSHTAPHPSVHHFSARSNINPCMSTGGNWSTTSQLYIMSCTAQQYQMILVLNTCDVQTCSKSTDPACPSDGRYQYNTQVVFNEHGDLVAKYHKSHLFGGSAVFDQSAPVAVTFSTSLGVTFGTFICFDILYPYPATTLTGMGITHFVFSSWWTNFPPGHVATMQQQAWSRQHQVALIAANTGTSPSESGGGIYLAGEPLVTLFKTDGPDANNVRQLTVAKIPLVVPRLKSVPPAHIPVREIPASSLIPDDTYAICALGSPLGPTGNCSLITTNLAGASYTLSVQSGSLTCQATITAANSPNETYGLFAYQGVIHFPNTIDPLSLEVCGISQCKNAGILFGYTVCEPVFSGATVFSSFIVTGSGFNPSTSLFPTLALDNAQVVDREWLGFQDLTNGTLRTAQLNTQTTITNSMFSTMIFGVVPNK